MKNLEGSEVSLRYFAGKVVFLNFWATWCGPCRIEMPSMEKLWQRFKEQAFVILAVDLREGKEEVSSFMKDYGLTFSVLLDSKGEVGSMYTVRAIPTTFLIDLEGMIVGGALGARDWASADAFVSDRTSSIRNKGRLRERNPASTSGFVHPVWPMIAMATFVSTVLLNSFGIPVISQAKQKLNLL